MIDFILAFLLFLNITTFFIFGLDKCSAIVHDRRIRERTLLLCSLFGGVGGFFGMVLFRHKIRKARFCIIVPFFGIIDGVLIWMVWTAR